MKKYFTIQLLLLFMYASTLISAPEIWIQNYSSRVINNVFSPRTITVKIYPVSMVFNGLYDYNLLALHRTTNANRNFYYITGVGDSDEVKRTHYVLSSIIGYHELKINHDNDFSGNNGNDIAISDPVVGLVTNNDLIEEL